MSVFAVIYFGLAPKATVFSVVRHFETMLQPCDVTRLLVAIHPIVVPEVMAVSSHYEGFVSDGFVTLEGFAPYIWEKDLNNQNPPCHMMCAISQKPGGFRRTWTDAEELLKEKSFFILSFVFLSEFVNKQVQTNIF